MKKLFIKIFGASLIVFIVTLIAMKYFKFKATGVILVAIFALVSYFIAKFIDDEKNRKLKTAIKFCRDTIQGEPSNDGEVEEEYLPFVELIEFQKSALDLQMSEVKDLARMRSEFTANATHELKTPLVSIRGYAELIETGMAKDEDIKKFVGIIKEQGDHLLTLINEMLELSQIEAGSDEEDFEEVRLSEIIEEAFGRVRYQADSQEIFLSYSGDAVVMGVPKLIAEMFYNLIENAVKYNKFQGLVEVLISEDEDEVKVIVRDTGIGIAKENQRRIFERFYRVDKSHSKKIKGTGLGLAIVKHVAELHKAEIHIKSELNKGTEITIYFPKKK